MNGINGVPAALLRPHEAVRPRVEQERVATPAPRAAEAPVRIATGGLLAPRHEVLPSEAPAGTDPELWQVLTSEERAYFAKMTSLGPLTYGRPSTSAPTAETPLGRGGRLDVRA